MSAESWQLEGHVARFSLPCGEASVDLTRPGNGISLQLQDNAATPLYVLGVVLGQGEPLDSSAIDAYVRGADLVAIYDERPPRQLRAGVYWRRISAAEFSPEHADHVACAFDLILSVNTNLLDDDPQSAVRSVFSPALQVLNVRTNDRGQSIAEPIGQPAVATLRQPGAPTACFIVRLASRWSYVEMVHPADYRSSDVISGDGAPPRAQLAHQLFRQRLEKGVILRARVRAALVARKNDEAAAIAALERFASTEPPLTV